MHIKIKQEYPGKIDNVRVDEDVYNEVANLAKRNDVSMATIVRGVLEEAVNSGLVVDKD